MERSRTMVLGALVVAAAATLGLASAAAGDDSAPAGTLDLSIRARALGILPEPHAAASLGLESMRAPTGAGTTRMPQMATASDRRPGVYIGVIVCEPGGERVYAVRADDPGSLPERGLRGTGGPQSLFIPGRP